MRFVTLPTGMLDMGMDVFFLADVSFLLATVFPFLAAFLAARKTEFIERLIPARSSVVLPSAVLQLNLGANLCPLPYVRFFCAFGLEGRTGATTELRGASFGHLTGGNLNVGEGSAKRSTES